MYDIRPKRPDEVTEEDRHGEAVYVSILGELDTLSPEQQLSVVHNWARYVLLKTCQPRDSSQTVQYRDLMEHCYHFAQSLMDIPMHEYERQTGIHPSTVHCGKCAACLLNGNQPPKERTVQ